MIKELEKNPIAGVACRRVGISRATLYRYLQSDSEFAEKLKEARKIGRLTLGDMAESVVVHHMNNKDMKAAMYYLDRNHPRYMKKDKNEGPESKENLADYIKGYVNGGQKPKEPGFFDYLKEAIKNRPIEPIP